MISVAGAAGLLPTINYTCLWLHQGRQLHNWFSHCMNSLFMP